MNNLELEQLKNDYLVCKNRIAEIAEPTMLRILNQASQGFLATIRQIEPFYGYDLLEENLLISQRGALDALRNKQDWDINRMYIFKLITHLYNL